MVYSRSRRLTNKQDFQSVFAKPSKVTHKRLQALFIITQRAPARLGVVIAKHIVPRAVDRSAIRRIVRESFRMNALLTHQPLDIVVLVRSKKACEDKKQLRQEVDELWQRICDQR